MAKKPLKKERDYQPELKDRIEKVYFPGSTVLKNDPDLKQGFPDLTVLFPNGKYALLETKRSEHESKQPNQEYYVEDHKKKGYASFIYPENEEQVIKEMKEYYERKER